MMRFVNVLLFLLIAATSVGVYRVKYAVMDLEKEATLLSAQLLEERDSIRTYEAEWTYLNEPRRLEGLAQRHLTLQPVSARQILTPAQLPLRPPPEDAQTFAELPDGTIVRLPQYKPWVPAWETRQ
ncbi:MAG: hypothetical protein LPL00_05840 [Alphaproteobacteria bacterium]|nr:hypothetical protein [Alphaproteobacteria bacterium]MDX5369058.1 hypothetical protein [Alphaproteobacteria bacterium]MDX5463762.1 hypothetical protein [Alphaproteobacteria bacterium]